MNTVIKILVRKEGITEGMLNQAKKSSHTGGKW